MLTKQQKMYAKGRCEGMSKRAAAIASGCPVATASQQASRYERNHKVVDHMIRLGMNISPITAPPEGERRKRVYPPNQTLIDAALKIEERSKVVSSKEFTCPLDYMLHVMNEVQEDPKLRLDAAKALASFTITKPGEKGKKEERQDAADNVAGLGRFGVSKAPKRLLN